MSTRPTTNDFNYMLSDYAPNQLLTDGTFKRHYFLDKVSKDENWLTGGSNTTNTGDAGIVVPIKAAGGSSVRFGKLTAAADIAQSVVLRGKVIGAKEVYGSMKFYWRDLIEHGKVNEQNFLRLLPNELNDLMDNLKNAVSLALFKGNSFAKVTGVDDQASGILVVDRPDRFVIGQHCEIFNGTTAVYADNAGSGGTVGNEVYVTGININTKEVTFSATRGGSAINFSTNVAVDYLFRHHDQYLAADQSFTSIRSVLLSAANGGDATYLLNVKTGSAITKAAYPFLQAYNIDGSGVTSSNILEKIFDAMVEVRTYAKCSPTEAVMSLRNLGYAMKSVESQKGSFKVAPESTKASIYGWMEISVMSLDNGRMVKLVGVPEMDDDIIIFPDWKACTLYSNGGIRKIESPEGLQYKAERDETGHYYLVDVALIGEVVFNEPWKWAIMHSIP